MLNTVIYFNFYQFKKMYSLMTLICLTSGVRFTYCNNDEAEIKNFIIDGRKEKLDEFNNDIIKKSFQEIVSSNKKSRFLTFNNDAHNIRVEMIFAIPFLNIPIGGNPSETDHHGGINLPHIDISLKALLVMAGILITVYILIPKVMHEYFPHKFPTDNLELVNVPTFKNLNSMLERVDEALSLFNIDAESCAQKALCWTMKSTSHKIKQGKSSISEKLFDTLSSSSFIRHIFEDTQLWKIFKNITQFKENSSCEQFSKKCSITQNLLNDAVNSIFKTIKDES